MRKINTYFSFKKNVLVNVVYWHLIYFSFFWLLNFFFGFKIAILCFRYFYMRENTIIFYSTKITTNRILWKPISTAWKLKSNKYYSKMPSLTFLKLMTHVPISYIFQEYLRLGLRKSHYFRYYVILPLLFHFYHRV